MKSIKSKYDQLLEKLQNEGAKIQEKPKDGVIEKVEKALNEYRFENQKKIKDSQEEIATIILTA